MLKGLLIVSTGMYSLPVFACFFKRLNLVWAAEGPCAADVNVAFLLEVRQLEVAEHRNAVVVRVIVVPLVAIRMYEEDIVGKRVVVVDYVAVSQRRVSAM